MNAVKRMLTVFTLLLLISCTSGEQSNDSTISLFFNSPTGVVGMWGQDPASQRLIDRTGVNFKVRLPATNDDTMLNLMIVGNDLPDIIINNWNSPTWNEMIANNQLADLDELIDKYAPFLRDNVGKDIFDVSRIDGKLFKINNNVEGEAFQESARRYNGLVMSNQPVLLVRQDYFEEIGSPEIRNADEFIDALVLMHNNHPDKMGFYGEAVFVRNDIGRLAFHFGVPEWYEQDGQLLFRWKAPVYRDAISFMRRMASLGLLTREAFVDDSTVSRGKVDQGLPIAISWTLGETGKIPADNPNTTYQPLPPWDTYMQYRSGAGFRAVGISESSKHKEEAIKFLEFMNTMEGVLDASWGVEGEWSGDPVAGPHWHRVDGKPTWHQEYYTAKLADWDGILRRNGLGAYDSFIFDSALLNLPGWIPGDTFMERQNALFSERIVYRPDLFTITIPGGSEYDVARARITDLLREAVANFAFAPSDDEAWAIWDTFIANAEAAGAGGVEEFVTAAWKK